MSPEESYMTDFDQSESKKLSFRVTELSEEEKKCIYQQVIENTTWLFFVTCQKNWICDAASHSANVILYDVDQPMYQLRNSSSDTFIFLFFDFVWNYQNESGSWFDGGWSNL